MEHDLYLIPPSAETAAHCGSWPVLKAGCFRGLYFDDWKRPC